MKNLSKEQPREGKQEEYKYLGDFSAVPPEHSRAMMCHKCEVRWTGCYDNFQCPKCGGGELPTSDLDVYKIFEKIS